MVSIKPHKKVQNALLIGAGIIFLLLIWTIIAAIVKSPVVSYPHEAFIRLFTLLGELTTYQHVFNSLLRLISALFFAVIIGFLLGALGGSFESFHTFLKPVMISMRTLPTASIILIVVSLTKIKFAPIIVVALIALPIAYEAMVAGLHNVDDQIRSALKIEGDKNFYAFRKVLLPSTWPYLALGIVQMVGLGMKVEIMSEVLAGTTGNFGLGFAIYQAYAFEVQYVDIYAYSILAISIIAGAEILLNYLKKRLQVR
ncbi:MAG: ABC transporter permease subunit [Bacilli bacterium]|jgi:NitT/TauT family transport system permease protein